MWKDKLASYDGEYISYDEIGNPWSYTQDRYLEWQGRELRFFGTDDSRLQGCTVTAAGRRDRGDLAQMPLPVSVCNVRAFGGSAGQTGYFRIGRFPIPMTGRKGNAK